MVLRLENTWTFHAKEDEFVYGMETNEPTHVSSDTLSAAKLLRRERYIHRVHVGLILSVN